jgi:hypothetical protein
MYVYEVCSLSANNQYVFSNILVTEFSFLYFLAQRQFEIDPPGLQ